MVLDDYRFVLKQAQEQGCESGTCDMHDIGAPDKPPKGNKTRSARHAKREHGIVEIARRSLCYERDFELRCAVRAAQPLKAAGERENDGLNATNTWGEVMRIDKQFHS
jgi:hypothetical protein